MSDRLLHRTLLVLTLIGVGIAGYLTYIHYRGFDPICAVGHGCEKVQNSEWAKLAGVPVPLLGLIGYVGILGTLLVRGELARLATAGMAIIGFAFSMYLTYREIFTIEAICQWCVGSAVVMTLILIFSVIRALRVDDDAYASDLASEPEHEPV
ncbi:MAG TPA: vitamin K epoxide reductase family protein [Conexibacter sp.]|nr:vitamin K epoxide reductase family protein [Conexibacter sp.]